MYVGVSKTSFRMHVGVSKKFLQLVYGCVWVCPGVFGYVWECLGVSGYVWVCLGMSGYVWVCLLEYAAIKCYESSVMK